MTAEPDGGAPSGSSRDGGRRPARCSAVLVVVVILVFALVNLEDAKIDFVFTQVTIPIFFVIVVPALIGFVSGRSSSTTEERRHRA